MTAHRLMIAVTVAAMALSLPSWAQETCPPPHQDYRKPTPVWAGFGYQVNACPGDKIEVAASLVLEPDSTLGILKIPQTLPWNVNIAALPRAAQDQLRRECQADLPCAAHFRVSVLSIDYPIRPPTSGEYRKGHEWCTRDGPLVACRPDHGPGRVLATLDGWD